MQLVSHITAVPFTPRIVGSVATKPLWGRDVLSDQPRFGFGCPICIGLIAVGVGAKKGWDSLKDSQANTALKALYGEPLTQELIGRLSQLTSAQKIRVRDELVRGAGQSPELMAFLGEDLRRRLTVAAQSK